MSNLVPEVPDMLRITHYTWDPTSHTLRVPPAGQEMATVSNPGVAESFPEGACPRMLW